MKQVSPELLNYLHSRTEFYMCDLYEITLKSGLVFRYASYDRDITLVDGRVFSCAGPQFKRSRIKLSSEIRVDKLTVTVNVDDQDKIGAIPMMQIAHNGGFDEATLSLFRCFLGPATALDGNLMLNLIETETINDPESVCLQSLCVVGIVEMFTGYIDIDGGGGLEMKWTVKSGVQKLNVEYPPKKYYPTCSHSCYDIGCGLVLADFTSTGEVTAVSSYTDFETDLTAIDGYYEQGGIEWLSGALAGVTAPIKTSYQTDGRIVMLIPLDASPAIGDTFNIYPGCDKTPATCNSKFNNLARNRATPYIPLKESIR